MNTKILVDKTQIRLQIKEILKFEDNPKKAIQKIASEIGMNENVK